MIRAVQKCSVLMKGVVMEEEFDAECNTYCTTVRQIYSLKTERAGRRGLDKRILIKNFPGVFFS